MRRIAVTVSFALGVSGCRNGDVAYSNVQSASFAVIHGVLTAPDGSPVSGARIQMRENERAPALTSVLGAYRLSVESRSLVAGAQTVLFVIIAPPGGAARDTTERHARVTLYPSEPVPDSSAISLVADQRR